MWTGSNNFLVKAMLDSEHAENQLDKKDESETFSKSWSSNSVEHFFAYAESPFPFKLTLNSCKEIANDDEN